MWKVAQSSHGLTGRDKQEDHCAPRGKAAWPALRALPPTSLQGLARCGAQPTSELTGLVLVAEREKDEGFGEKHSFL